MKLRKYLQLQQIWHRLIVFQHFYVPSSKRRKPLPLTGTSSEMFPICSQMYTTRKQVIRGGTANDFFPRLWKFKIGHFRRRFFRNLGFQVNLRPSKSDINAPERNVCLGFSTNDIKRTWNLTLWKMLEMKARIRDYCSRIKTDKTHEIAENEKKTHFTPLFFISEKDKKRFQGIQTWKSEKRSERLRGTKIWRSSGEIGILFNWFSWRGNSFAKIPQWSQNNIWCNPKTSEEPITFGEESKQEPR